MSAPLSHKEHKHWLSTWIWYDRLKCVGVRYLFQSLWILSPELIFGSGLLLRRQHLFFLGCRLRLSFLRDGIQLLGLQLLHSSGTVGLNANYLLLFLYLMLNSQGRDQGWFVFGWSLRRKDVAEGIWGVVVVICVGIVIKHVQPQAGICHQIILIGDFGL